MPHTDSAGRGRKGEKHSRETWAARSHPLPPSPPPPPFITPSSAKCEAPVAAASSAFSAQLAEFQARLGRCAHGCQDAAQGRLGPDPSPGAVVAAQAAMGACVQGCAGSFTNELPTLKARLESAAGKAAGEAREAMKHAK